MGSDLHLVKKNEAAVQLNAVMSSSIALGMQGSATQGPCKLPQPYFESDFKFHNACRVRGLTD